MPGLYNHELKPILTFPENGYFGFADIFDEGKEDVVINSDTAISIYSSRPTDINKPASGIPLKQTKRLSHQTVYFGAELDK